MYDSVIYVTNLRLKESNRFLKTLDICIRNEKVVFFHGFKKIVLTFGRDCTCTSHILKYCGSCRFITCTLAKKASFLITS